MSETCGSGIAFDEHGKKTDGDSLLMLLNCSHLLLTVDSTLVSKMTLSPASRLTELESRLSAIQTHTTGPCGGFTAAYRCACDYHGIQFVDEIAWVGVLIQARQCYS